MSLKSFEQLKKDLLQSKVNAGDIIKLKLEGSKFFDPYNYIVAYVLAYSPDHPKVLYDEPNLSKGFCIYNAKGGVKEEGYRPLTNLIMTYGLGYISIYDGSFWGNKIIGYEKILTNGEKELKPREELIDVNPADIIRLKLRSNPLFHLKVDPYNWMVGFIHKKANKRN